MTTRTKAVADEDHEEEDTQCGCQLPCQKAKHRIHVKCLAYFAKPAFVLFLISAASFLQHAAISGLYGMSMSTVQKRFQLQSSESGLIAIGYDVSSVCGMTLMLIMGGNLNQPIWIGIGVLLMSLGCFVFAIPHFIAPMYSPIVVETLNFCNATTSPSCSSSSMRNYKYMFLAAFTIIGAGMAPLYTHGVAYIDKIVSKNMSALYTSIFYACGGFAPAVGFVLGGLLLQIYTYIGQEPDGVTVDDYAWIGAWWLGFVITAVLLLATAIFIYMLPRNIPNTEKYQQDRNTEVHTDLSKKSEEMDEVETSLLKSLKYLLTNKCLMLGIAGNSLNYAFVFGFNTFGAKYFEAQLGLTAFISSVLYGIPSVFASALSQLFTGFIMFKFKLNLSQIIKMMLICSVVSAMFSFGLFIHCPDIIFAGGTIPYSESNVTMLDASCNANCGCSTDLYEPVCGEDNVTYFSPCYAGCETNILDGSFHNCSCVQVLSANADPGICEQGFCHNTVWFMICIFFAFFTSLMTFPLSMQVILRCVPFKLRVRSVSISRVFSYIFGTAPGRILTGVLVDLACASWQTDCSEQGSCAVYHRKEMARNIAIILLVETWAMVLIYFLLNLIYIPQGIAETEVEEANQAMIE